MKKINLLGATGSIGIQTIDILRSYKEEFQLKAVSAGRNIEGIRKVINEFKPELVSVQDKESAELLRSEFINTKFVYGNEGLTEVACYSDSEMVVNAVMGSVGLGPTLAAIESGKHIAIANKETLVTAGHLVMAAAEKYGVQMLPVDSEHSAIFQCLQGENSKNIERLILTASGGSFRNRTREELVDVSVEDALAHPNWAMGAKITIDCATMMNKGLEVIEAHWLFNLPYENIDVLIHPQSIIHSMVEFHDSSVMAQLGTPDMRVPIQLALSYPDRLPLMGAKRLNLAEVATLNFKEVDFKRYPCLRMAYEAGKTGGTMPTVMNAANEVAVSMFLNRKIPFLEIESIVETAMAEHNVLANPDLETIQAVDAESRIRVLEKF
ncbi:MAG: 1-deoxy-D-xylulose-5-phosphate reductoisomerase [Bacillales bacterium]|jgi:1-deoxy-D-xylulose-5-phosphate reductoisomerase|nr:1-deoxy-D-xylulose-5-phosphate reductoisomerase [Bacillales bacterium]